MPKSSKKTKNHFALKFGLSLSIVAAVGLIYIDALVRYNLNERQWQIPARVYSRAMSLGSGVAMAPRDLLYRLRLMGYSEQRSARDPGSFSHWNNRFEIYSRGYQSAQGPVAAKRFKLEFDGNRIDLAVLFNGWFCVCGL